jgi:hypothetical protein
LPDQIAALQRAFPGDTVKIVRHKGTIYDGPYLAKLVKEGRYDDVVLVAHADIFEQAVAEGIHPIRAIMLRRDESGYEFLRFERVTGCKITVEQL